MRLFSLKLHADDIFLVSNRTLLYYDLLLIVTAVFNGCCESLGFKGFFDDFHFTNEEIEGQGDLFPNKCDDEYKILINGINTFLIKYRSRYLKEASDAYISKLIDDKLYPEFDTTNFIQAYQKKELV